MIEISYSISGPSSATIVTVDEEDHLVGAAGHGRLGAEALAFLPPADQCFSFVIVSRDHNG